MSSFPLMLIIFVFLFASAKDKKWYLSMPTCLSIILQSDINTCLRKKLVLPSEH